MKHAFKRNSHRLLALLLTLIMVLGMVPTAFAAQDINYRDPAEHWKSAANRTNELDTNAHNTHETFFCYQCDKYTSFLTMRAPEYTRDGQTAASRNIRYSDGTMRDGETMGTILDGTPGVDAYYTGYHWCKVVCENCGTLNSNMPVRDYGFAKNVYWIYDCEAVFMEDLDPTVTYEYTDSTYHTVTTKGGQYCAFCYGTNYKTDTKMERHDMETDILPQIGHQRFAALEHCALCTYEKYSFTVAKAVIADYYGTVDGQAHTISVTDLSEAGVTTSIRYGNSADNCTLTSAPNYTEEGQYTVYYEITYTYKNTEMTENGVAYVWLRDENASASCDCGCGKADCDCKSGKNCDNCNSNCGSPSCGDSHNYVLLETVAPTCLTLGYDRYLCVDCGKIEKRDYEAALGHAYQGIQIREASCEETGKLLELCSRCGNARMTSTPKGDHKYESHKVAATCTNPGYTVKECTVCGDRHITDITPALPHNYEAHVIAASCEAGGKTIHQCEGCGSSFVTDYTSPLGHAWDNGTVVTDKTCDGSGVTEYRCVRCGYHRLEGDAATGHVPGAPATCTEPQVCTECGVVLAPATGHKESDWIVDKEPTTDSEGGRHKECENCGEVLESENIERLKDRNITDSHGEATVGGYLVIVSDTNTEAPVMGAYVYLKLDGSLSIRLPDDRLLDYADQTTVTVLVKTDKSAVPGVDIAVTDRNDNYSADTTDKAGQITVPGTSGKTNPDGKTTVGWEDEDGNCYTLTVKVEDHETGRPIEDADVRIGTTGRITVTLPDGEDMDEDNRITVTVTDHKKIPQEGLSVVVKSDLGRVEEAKTDADGKLTVPAVIESERHGAYIYGYPDGTFGPSKSMSRSEAAAIFARLLAEKKGDNIIPAANTKFEDIPANAWYSGYVKYLSNFGVIYGRGDTTFAPNAAITRAEFTAFAVRFFAAYGDGDAEIMDQYKQFNDVDDGYWAAEYIKDAALHGWVEGYGDGTFRADDTITRAEVVTLMGRLLGHQADKQFVDGNVAKLNTFSDMSKAHWAYYAVMEAANTHDATMDEAETWSR